MSRIPEMKKYIKRNEEHELQNIEKRKENIEEKVKMDGYNDNKYEYEARKHEEKLTNKKKYEKTERKKQKNEDNKKDKKDKKRQEKEQEITHTKTGHKHGSEGENKAKKTHDKGEIG